MAGAAAWLGLALLLVSLAPYLVAGQTNATVTPERVSNVSTRGSWLAELCASFVESLPREKPSVDVMVASGFAWESISSYITSLGVTLGFLGAIAVVSLFFPFLFVYLRWYYNCCGGWTRNRSGANWIWQHRRDESCRGYSRKERFIPHITCLALVPVIFYWVILGQVYNDSVSSGVNDIFVDGIVAIDALDAHLITIGGELRSTATQIVNEITDGIPELLQGNTTLGTRIQRQLQALKDGLVEDLKKIQDGVDKAKQDIEKIGSGYDDALEAARKAREKIGEEIGDGVDIGTMPPINDVSPPNVPVPVMPPDTPVPTTPPVENLPNLPLPPVPAPSLPPSVPSNPFALTPGVRINGVRMTRRGLLQLPVPPVTPPINFPTPSLPNLDVAGTNIDTQWDGIGADVDNEVVKLNVMLNYTIRALLANAVDQVNALAGQIEFLTTPDGAVGRVRGDVVRYRETVADIDNSYRYPIFTVITWLSIAILIPGGIGSFLALWWFKPRLLFMIQAWLSFVILFLTLVMLAVYFPLSVVFQDVCDIADDATLKTMDRLNPEFARRGFIACLADENLLDALDLTDYIQTPLVGFKSDVDGMLGYYLNVDNFFDFGGNMNLTTDVGTISDNMGTAVNATLNDRFTMNVYLSSLQSNVTFVNASLTNLIATLSPATFNYSDSRVYVALDALNNRTRPQARIFTLQNYTSLNMTWFTPASRYNISVAYANLDYEVKLNRSVNAQVEILRMRLIEMKAKNDAAAQGVQSGQSAQAGQDQAAGGLQGYYDQIAAAKAAFEVKAKQIMLGIRDELNEALGEIRPRVLAKMDAVINIILAAAHRVATCGFVGRFYRAVKTDVCVTVRTSVSVLWVVGLFMSVVLVVQISMSVLLSKRAGYLYSGDKTLHPRVAHCMGKLHGVKNAADYENQLGALPRFNALSRHVHSHMRLIRDGVVVPEAAGDANGWIEMSEDVQLHSRPRGSSNAEDWSAGAVGPLAHPRMRTPSTPPGMRARLREVPEEHWVENHPAEPVPHERGILPSNADHKYSMYPAMPLPEDKKHPVTELPTFAGAVANIKLSNYHPVPEYHHPGAGRLPMSQKEMFYSLKGTYSVPLGLFMGMLTGAQVTMANRTEPDEVRTPRVRTNQLILTPGGGIATWTGPNGSPIISSEHTPESLLNEPGSGDSSKLPSAFASPSVAVPFPGLGTPRSKGKKSPMPLMPTPKLKIPPQPGKSRITARASSLGIVVAPNPAAGASGTPTPTPGPDSALVTPVRGVGLEETMLQLDATAGSALGMTTAVHSSGSSARPSAVASPRQPVFRVRRNDLNLAGALPGGSGNEGSAASTPRTMSRAESGMAISEADLRDTLDFSTTDAAGQFVSDTPRHPHRVVPARPTDALGFAQDALDVSGPVSATMMARDYSTWSLDDSSPQLGASGEGRFATGDDDELYVGIGDAVPRRLRESEATEMRRAHSGQLAQQALAVYLQNSAILGGETPHGTGHAFAASVPASAVLRAAPIRPESGEVVAAGDDGERHEAGGEHDEGLNTSSIGLLLPGAGSSHLHDATAVSAPVPASEYVSTGGRGTDSPAVANTRGPVAAAGASAYPDAGVPRTGGVPRKVEQVKAQARANPGSRVNSARAAADVLAVYLENSMALAGESSLPRRPGSLEASMPVRQAVDAVGEPQHEELYQGTTYGLGETLPSLFATTADPSARASGGAAAPVVTVEEPSDDGSSMNNSRAGLILPGVTSRTEDDF